MRDFTALLVVLVFLVGGRTGDATDWPQFGRDVDRNPVSPEKNPPLDWHIGEYDRATRQWIQDKARNIKWIARLGSMTFGTPVIAGGHVYIGTNNGAAYLKRYPSDVDLGCLLCFRESDGAFLWQFSEEKLPNGRTHDWPLQGIGASPLVEGNRMWFVSNRCEAVCLDTEGFRDGENDGPYVNEPLMAHDEADVVWRYDLIKELGVFPHTLGMGPHRRCSPTASYKNRIYIVTGNGVDMSHVNIPAPGSPSLVCFDKDTGKVLWTDASPGKSILHNQAADPLVTEIGGRGQVIVPQGDGWIRSFDALTGELIWKFDINTKKSKWRVGGRGERNHIWAAPVCYKGRLYVGSGQEAEHGEGDGRLVCIDPTKTGDISSELAVDAEGHLLPHRRTQAVIPERGERAIPNPNSGLIWEFTRWDHNRDGEIEFEEEFHRTLSSVAIKDDLLVAPDFSGLVHCLDVRTGEPCWAYDSLAMIWCSPLIVDDKVYVGDEDGDLMIFGLSADPKEAMKDIDGKFEPLNAEAIDEVSNMRTSIFSSPVFANGVLYVATRTHLFAIAAPTVRKDNPQGNNPQATTPQGRQAVVSVTTEVPIRVVRVPKPVFAPTPQDVVAVMLDAAHVGQNDTVVDLGSGDGRIAITAAKEYGAKAVGYEIDPDLVHTSKQRARQEGVSTLVEIKEQDMYTADLGDARVVAVFLYPVVLQKLKSKFAEMKPGSWIVSHHYEIPDTEPTRVVTVNSNETGDDHRVLLYRTPLASN